jgi:hypothetical protein
MTDHPAEPMTDELLPCPFCALSDSFVERSDFSSAYVMCNACCARGPIALQDDDDEEVPGEAGARDAWNRRAAPNPSVLVEALERVRGWMLRVPPAGTHGCLREIMVIDEALAAWREGNESASP